MLTIQYILLHRNIFIVDDNSLEAIICKLVMLKRKANYEDNTLVAGFLDMVMNARPFSRHPHDTGLYFNLK